jgi:hypothetical protein
MKAVKVLLIALQVENKLKFNKIIG